MEPFQKTDKNWQPLPWNEKLEITYNELTTSISNSMLHLSLSSFL